MSLKSLAKAAHVQVQRPWLLIAACSFGILLTVLLPSDPTTHRDRPSSEHPFIHAIEDQGRFINTIVQVALPIIKRDAIGFMQNIYIGVGSTALTHGLKHSLDRVIVAGVRLGERPNGGRYNLPSGHASMASCAAYFVGRRYGWWHLWYQIPITLLTMFARVALDAHTISAVIAGALAGIVGAAIFTGVYGMTKVLVQRRKGGLDQVNDAK
ncbi:phosphatase PAP2 family protein [Herbaspirillum sp. alder98]|uniref:phosphatase PAP2 family protein n=1 Tax=Herbaspirillum sp. alder98 TaxID=2913096 RepID=UPI001CD8D249|nr:phosphatase PAP2 family protein [Herbaspirillum sp. alder98]MCA1323610.1 phosphatase PAP2 family protein [Herbaspirillum sp. alder98]